LYREKFPEQIVSGVILGKPAELSIPEKEEHLRNTKTAAKGSRIANHTWSNNHALILKMCQLLTKALLTMFHPGCGPSIFSCKICMNVCLIHIEQR